MRAVVAKQLRREAEAATVGQPPANTRRIYKRLKRVYKT